jgi:hypothetical protein
VSSFVAQAALEHAVTVVTQVCQLAGSASCIRDLRTGLRAEGIVRAVERHDTPVLFNWLMSMISYQGIADRVAAGFIRDHGNVTWEAISGALAAAPACPKLAGYWTFSECYYHKGLQTCAQPAHFAQCLLPRQHLRNGRLNQTAYSLFLFLRDIADNDLVSWIDRHLGEASGALPAHRSSAMRDALVAPLRGVYGVSDKVLTMILSLLLIGAGTRRSHWVETGISFVVVDTLLHNFLHRTGILDRFAAGHAYGPACYAPGGCADLVQLTARHIDAKAFNPAFPSCFPWFVHNAIWRYCAESGFNVCNGRQITDQGPCDNIYCRIRSSCGRVPLYHI